MSVRCEHSGDSSVARAVGRPRSPYVTRQARALCPLLLAVEMTLALPALAVGTETPTPVEIRRLITQLGSDEFAEREAASRRLEAIGAPALPALHRAAASQDPEVRRRAGQVIPAIHARLFGEVRRFDTGSEHVLAVAFSPDGRYLLSGGDGVTLPTPNPTPRLWEVPTGRQVRALEGRPRSPTATAGTAASASGPACRWSWSMTAPSP